MRSRTSSEPRIARLPDILVNQIAAGEVVERPASVVKELVENSLDAGASRVDVLLEGGGIDCIQIIDDGCGLVPEDLALCLERHTTSKLRTVTDLESIETFGFRGEALASIASVAELEIISRTLEAPAAHRLAVQYGVTTEPLRPTGAPVGTAITVRRLFERLPARQKYLRSPGTELSHCGRLMKEMAMAAPQTRFYLRHQNRLLAEYVAPGRRARFEEAFRVNWEPIEIGETGDGFALELFLSPPELAQDRGELYLFVNGRAVRNRSLLAAVRNAYLQVLGPHHEPSGAVYLDLRPDWVDVNVHPQKMEVRCLKQETIYPWILNTVRKNLGRLVPQAAPASLPASEAAPALEATDHVLAPLDAKVRYVGRFQTSYVVCQADDALFVVDTHTLHEKARRDSLRAKIAEGRVSPMMLLVPRLLKVPASLLAGIDSILPRLAAAGLELEPFGDGDIVVKSIPDAISESDIDAVVLDCLARVRGQADALDAFVDAVASLAATASDAASDRETQALVAALSPDDRDWTCAHGRPLWFRIPASTVDKHFRRSERELT